MQSEIIFTEPQLPRVAVRVQDLHSVNHMHVQKVPIHKLKLHAAMMTVIGSRSFKSCGKFNPKHETITDWYSPSSVRYIACHVINAIPRRCALYACVHAASGQCF